MAKDKKTFQDRLAEEIDEAITNASDEDIRKEAEEAHLVPPTLSPLVAAGI